MSNNKVTKATLSNMMHHFNTTLNKLAWTLPILVHWTHVYEWISQINPTPCTCATMLSSAHACMSMSMYISHPDPPPWSASNKQWTLFSFWLDLHALSYCLCHVTTTLAPCVPPPPSKFPPPCPSFVCTIGSPPPFPHFFLFFFFCHMFVLGYIFFGMWPFFFANLVGHVSIFRYFQHNELHYM